LLRLPSQFVVPANAGTDTPRQLLFEKGI